jgi:rRNA small subunit pseudouridine methyltransferase Nep1
MNNKYTFVQSSVQLLHKFSVRSSDGPTKLLKVIRNPVTDHLPVGCRKLGTSFSATNVINPKDLVPNEEPITIVVGAVAHGKVSIYKSLPIFRLFCCFSVQHYSVVFVADVMCSL